MRLTRKDALGLALAACTVVLLVAHGGGRHDRDVLAFVDVNLLPSPREKPRDRQVVVVRDGVVTRVGSLGSVGLPRDAHVIDGRGRDYLTTVRGAVSGTADDPVRVVPGSGAELLLLPGDPRIDPSVRLRPRGRVVDGAWRATADRTPTLPTAGRAAAGGH